MCLENVYKFFPELNIEDGIKKRGLGEQLNQLYYSKIVDGNPIYIWGTGNTTKNLLQEIVDLNIEAFVDNNITKEYIHYNEKRIPVIAPDCLKNGIYIIIASIYYNEISEQLIQLGKIEYLDFISWHYLLPTPKTMLETIMKAPLVTNWKCVEAMRTKRLQADGNCCFCACEGWRNQLVTNIFLDRDRCIEENIKARLFFYSIFSGKYLYCNRQVCPGLMRNWNNFDSKNIQWKKLEEKNNRIAKVIVPDFDRTCNLHCKKCRNQIIYESSKKHEYLTNYFIRKWMPYSNLTKLAGSGEVMASKYYRKILEYVGNQEGAVIYSNGTLLTNNVISEISEKTKGNCFFIISIDAVKKDTYCKLQGGGNFDILMKNLQGISEMIKLGKIKGFRLASVISKQNEKEVEEIVGLGRLLGAKAVTLLPLLNNGTYSSDEFEKMSLFTEYNNPKTKEIWNKIFQLQQLDDIKVFFCDPHGTSLAYEMLGFE